MKTILKVLLGLSLTSLFLQADQFTLLDLDTAKSAKKILTEQGQMLEFCEPCNDEQCKLTKISTLHISSPEADRYKINANGEEVDLAYVFVNENGSWKNLAMHLGLPAVDVSTVLDVSKCNSKSNPSVASESPATTRCIYPDCDSKEWSMSSFSKDYFYNSSASVLTLKNNSRYLGIWIAYPENGEFKKEYWQVDCISRSFGDEWYNVKPAVPGTAAMGLVKDICAAYPVKKAVSKKTKK